ncbi:unnamed protein product [Bursaphelenchus okinawaensis]|uniref:EGF-like domain-containing protein n=1 Tax=Bursaphelenchus okinawaensis TaxID=465554 RepID=A0A811KCR9_9BILA|nr:unnamed protein product [Bursaphelenchus okinawaensis]CAG9101819.1 unnamed protein product [Bursaphelenchus okinawaensis]
MKTPDAAVSLMLPHAPLDYNGSIQRRIPPPPERRKPIKSNVSWRFRVFNENTAVLFFLAFVLTLALFVAQSVFKNSFLTLYSRHEIVDLVRTDATFEIGKSTGIKAPARKLAYATIMISESANLALMFNTTNSARFVVYAMRTLSPTPTLYDFRRVVKVDRLHSQGVVIKEDAAEDVFYESENRNGLVTFPVHSGQYHIAILNDHIEPIVMTITPFLFTENSQNTCKFECFGKGSCHNGSCQCFPGYSGKYCQETSCPILCSGNGVFSNGECVCHQGYHGKICEKLDRKLEPSYLQPFDGGFHHSNIMPLSSELSAPKSTEASYVASTVNTKNNEIITTRSTLTCHNGGEARYNKCVCRLGFGGAKCDEIKCPNDCNGHGRCSDGICSCDVGWNGKDCGIDACPSSCSNNGKCKRVKGEFKCVCNDNFFGDACSFSIEQQCDDGSDNDNDGLTDCLDPDCCSSPHCKANPLCMTTSTNTSTLILPIKHASFYDNYKHLIEAGSAQRYADAKAFKKSLFSVVKLRIIDEKAGPLMGMRVNNDLKPKQGFTLTNKHGDAELAVNGGGYIQLALLRHPYGLLHYNVYVAENQLVDLGVLSIKMLQNAKNYSRTWNCPTTKNMDISAGVKNPEVRIYNNIATVPNMAPDSIKIQLENDISLVYDDKSSVLVFRWSNLEEVKEVLLRITVEERRFEYSMKPQSKFVFEYDRKDAKGQRTSGAMDAYVKIGYVFKDCQEPLWTNYKEKLIVKSDKKDCCGPLSLDIDNVYNSEANLFEYGNGTVIDLNKFKSLTPFKNNMTVTSPVDQILYLKDGSVILKQHDKVSYNGNEVLNGFDFKNAKMVLDSLRNEVNILFLKLNKVIKIRSLEKFSNPAENYQIVVESKGTCNSNIVECLKEVSVHEAKFSSIQDIAFDKHGSMLILDSNALFYIENNIVHLIQDFTTSSLLNKCNKTFFLKELGLNGAQRVLVDPLTEHIIVLDKNALVYRLDIHHGIGHRIYNGLYDCGGDDAGVGTVFDKAGTSGATSDKISTTTPVERMHTINHIEIDQSSNKLIMIGYLPGGELTSQSLDLNTNEVETIVKDLRRCKCVKAGCRCGEDETKNEDYAVSSLSVGYKGNILFTTTSPYGIFKLSPLEIFFDKSLATYTVTLPNTGEFHNFDRNGQLISTVNSTTLQRKREFRREIATTSDFSATKTDVIMASGEHLSVLPTAPNKWTITHGLGRKTEVQAHEGVVEIRKDDVVVKRLEFDVGGRLLRTDF